MQRYLLTDGRLFPSFMKFALPVLGSLFLQMIYGATDLVIVGRYADSTSVSAVATGSQVMLTITSIITGFTMGETILIGQLMGARRERECAGAVGSGIVFFVILALVLTAIMVPFAGNFAALMHAPPEAFAQTTSYIAICSMGFVFITGYNVVSAIMRGLGNSALPLLFVAIAATANIFGDLLLVAVFHMAATGVAISTVMSQGVSLLLAIVILKHRGLPFKFYRSDIRFDARSTFTMLRLGFPIALQDMMVGISFLIILMILNSMGLVASAAVGAVDKILGFGLLVPSAFSSAIATFVAQNMGAGKELRARHAMYYGMSGSLVFSLFFFFASQFAGETLVGFISRDALVIAAGAAYLKAYSWDCILVCFVFSMTGFFTGCGKTSFVMVQSLIGTFLVRIPFSAFMSRRPGVTMFQIGLAAPTASIVQILLCAVYLLSGKWRISSTERGSYGHSL